MVKLVVKQSAKAHGPLVIKWVYTRISVSILRHVRSVSRQNYKSKTDHHHGKDDGDYCY